MKLYVENQRITIVGKGWQVQKMIKQHMKKYETITDWTNQKSEKARGA